MPRPKKETKREMYNSSQKEEYIAHEMINATTIRQYFLRISPIESLFEKDIADMNVEELKAALTSLNVRSLLGRRHLLNIMRGYVGWAIYNKKTANENKIDNIKPEDISSNYAVRTQMLKSPEQVENILNIVAEKDYDGEPNREIRDRLVYWLLYSGMNLEELNLLKKTDINFETKTVVSPVNSEKVYEINDTIAELWKEFASIFYIEDARGRTNELVDSDYLFRPLVRKNMENTRTFGVIQLGGITKNISKKYYEITGEYIMISPMNIQISGNFYRLYLLEESGIDITADVIIKYIGITLEDHTQKIKMVYRYRKDYENWKEAFGYR